VKRRGFIEVLNIDEEFNIDKNSPLLLKEGPGVVESDSQNFFEPPLNPLLRKEGTFDIRP
jgi:hypothetical protein